MLQLGDARCLQIRHCGVLTGRPLASKIGSAIPQELKMPSEWPAGASSSEDEVETNDRIAF